MKDSPVSITGAKSGRGYVQKSRESNTLVRGLGERIIRVRTEETVGEEGYDGIHGRHVQNPDDLPLLTRVVVIATVP
jgi:hypothetical protein